MQPRCHPRISVEYSAGIQSDTGEGTGVLFDLSATGSRLRSDMNVEAGTYLALQVDIPQHRMPLAVDVSIVRWCEDGQFGVEFLRYGLGMRERVTDLVRAQLLLPHLKHLLKQSPRSPLSARNPYFSIN